MGRISRIIDAAVGAISPVAGLRRQAARAALASGQRSLMYAAAKSTRLTGSWSPVDSSVNTVIGNSSTQVRARVRQLVRDMPYFARAVDVVTDYTVGEAIRFQSRVKGGDGKLDKRVIQAIEDEFSYWMDAADVSGKLHYYEMMQLAKRQDLECGEFLLVKSYPSVRRNRRVPFQLQMIESDWLTGVSAQPGAITNKIEQGVEYDPDTGEVIAYHLADPWGFGRPRRIPAEDVVHSFKTLRPGQLRGISPFVPGVLMANDLDDLMTAELDAAKMAARYMAFVETPDPVFRQTAVGAAVDSTSGKTIEDMEHAIVEYLRPGEKVNFAHSERPGANFPPFVRLVLTMFAVTSGAPYELLTGDYQGLNFSTAKINRNDFANFLRPVAGRHIRHYGLRTFVPWMQAAVSSGVLNLPGFYANLPRYLACQWQPPGMEPVDPLREIKSNLDEIAAGLRSPQEVVQARGRDLEEVYDEIADAGAMADEKGIQIQLQKPSVAQANNPAAVEEQKNAAAVACMMRGIMESDQLLQEGNA